MLNRVTRSMMKREPDTPVTSKENNSVMTNTGHLSVKSASRSRVVSFATPEINSNPANDVKGRRGTRSIMKTKNMVPEEEEEVKGLDAEEEEEREEECLSLIMEAMERSLFENRGERKGEKTEGDEEQNISGFREGKRESEESGSDEGGEDEDDPEEESDEEQGIRGAEATGGELAGEGEGGAVQLKTEEASTPELVGVGGMGENGGEGEDEGYLFLDVSEENGKKDFHKPQKSKKGKKLKYKEVTWRPNTELPPVKFSEASILSAFNVRNSKNGILTLDLKTPEILTSSGKDFDEEMLKMLGEEKSVEVLKKYKSGVSLGKSGRKGKVTLETSLMEKLEKCLTVPPVDPRKLSKLSRKSDPDTAGRKWFDLPATPITPELKTELRLLKLRGVVDPKRHYKKADSTKFPKYFQLGTVIEGPADFYSGRLTKRERKPSFGAELLADEKLKNYRKRKYNEVSERAELKARFSKMRKQKALPRWARK